MPKSRLRKNRGRGRGARAIKAMGFPPSSGSHGADRALHLMRLARRRSISGGAGGESAHWPPVGAMGDAVPYGGGGGGSFFGEPWQRTSLSAFFGQCWRRARRYFLRATRRDRRRS